jgi:hypothetical protein
MAGITVTCLERSVHHLLNSPVYQVVVTIPAKPAAGGSSESLMVRAVWLVTVQTIALFKRWMQQIIAHLFGEISVTAEAQLCSTGSEQFVFLMAVGCMAVTAILQSRQMD